MNFTPKTEKELAEMGNLPAGVYPFEVATANAKKSQKGNDMIELDLIIHTPAGSIKKIKDYLLESTAQKLYNFCEVTGLKNKYLAGNLTAEDCLGKSGYVRLTIQKGKKKEDGSGDFWPDRNSVSGYDDEPASGGAVSPTTENQTGGNSGSDDAPF